MKKWIYGAIGLLVLLLVAYFGVGWYISNTILTPNRGDLPDNHQVISVENDSVTLTGPTYRFNAIIGANFDDQTSIFNKPDSTNENNEEATRKVSLGNIPSVGTKFFGDIWLDRKSDPKKLFDLDFEKVKYNETNSAIYVPANSQKWIIAAHGINGSPEEFLRYMPAINDSGFNLLAISYQNDPEAAASENGFYNYGNTEWRDIEDAINYVKSKQSSEVVLLGISYGSSIVSNFIKNSSLAPEINKIIFDSPSLDWNDTFKFELSKRGLPTFLANPGSFVASLRSGTDYADVSATKFTDKFTQNILVFHSRDDDAIPQKQSIEFKNKLGDRVKLVSYDTALHTLSWNYEKEQYEEELKNFLN